MAPFLPDDVVREILLRLQHSSSLARASLVCKHWRGLVTDPSFLRRLGGAPFLGVFHNNPPVSPEFIPAGGDDAPDCARASRFPPPAHPWLVRDCRRGLVLLCDVRRFLVWNPASDDRVPLPRPPPALGRYFGAALLRDDDDDGFRVAVAFVDDEGVAVGAVYASDTGAWGGHVTSKAPASGNILWFQKPGAVVGEAAAHWLLDGCRVLRLHAGGQQRPAVLSVLEPTNAPSLDPRDLNVQLTRTPDGGLGLTAVTGTALRQWVLKTDDRATSWMLSRKVSHLDALFPGPRRRRRPGRFREELSLASVIEHDDPESPPCARITGADEDGAMVFLRRMDGLFLLRLQPTPRISKICGPYYVMRKSYDIVFPLHLFFPLVGINV